MKFSAKMIVLLIFFLAIAAVNAAEEVNDDTILSESTDYNAVDNSATLSQSVTNTVDDNSTVSSEIDNSDSGQKEIMGSSVSDETVLGDYDHSFKKLQELIDSYTGDTFVLDTDYVYDRNYDTVYGGIIINKTGFTIDGNGHAVRGNPTHASNAGARMFIVTADHVTFKNLNLTDAYIPQNTSENSSTIGSNIYHCGGAIHWAGSYATVINCTFDYNNIYYRDGYRSWGSSIYWYGDKNFTLLNSTFLNTADYVLAASSAVFLQGNDSYVGGCTFVDSYTSDNYGAAVYLYGGNNRNTYSNITLFNNTFRDHRHTKNPVSIMCCGYANVIGNTFYNVSAYAGSIVLYGYQSLVNFSYNTYELLSFSYEGALHMEDGGRDFFYVGHNTFKNCRGAYRLFFIRDSTYAGTLIIEENQFKNITLTSNNVNAAGVIQIYNGFEMAYVHNNNFSDINNKRYGGIIWSSSPISIENNTFYNYTDSPDPDTDVIGSAIYCTNYTRIFNNTFIKGGYNVSAVPDVADGIIAIGTTGFGTIINNTFIDNNITNSFYYHTGIISNKGNNTSILNNRFIASTCPDSLGGIVYNMGNNVTIYNNTITNTIGGTGGIVYNGGSDIHIYKNNITNVHSTVDGGAVYILNGNVTIYNNNFTNVHADNNYGTIYCNGENSTIYNNKYINSSALSQGVVAIGSNIKLYDEIFNNTRVTNGQAGTILITGNNNNITNIRIYNTSAFIGGSIVNSGNGNNLTNVFINHTMATLSYGGAIYSTGNNFNVKTLKVYNANATLDGGAFYNDGSDGSLSDAIFDNIFALRNGGAIFWSGNKGNISDITITNAYAEGDGGAIYWIGSQGHMSNINLIKNTHAISGGAIYCSGANCAIDTAILNNIRATGDGGAIYWTGANANLTKIIIENVNSSGNGGAIFGTGVDSNLNDLTFKNINSSSNGGALYWAGARCALNNLSFINTASILGNGGALYLSGDKSFARKIRLENITSEGNGAVYWSGSYSNFTCSTFINCVAKGMGGAIYWTGSYGILNQSTFNNNSANNGGAILWNAVKGEIYNSTFTNNYAKGNGGGIYWIGNNATIYDLDMIGNNVSSKGGAIYLKGNSAKLYDLTCVNNKADVDAGAILIDGSEGTLTNSTFIHNTARTNGGSIFWAGVSGTLYNLNITNGSAGVGGAVYWYANNANISKINFINNNATIAGAIYMGGLTGSKLIDSTFTNNNASTNGGAIYWTSSNGNLTNCIFNGATARDGGAIYWAGDTAQLTNLQFNKINATNNGGIILVSAYGVNISNSNFSKSNASDGGAIYWSGANGYLTNATFSNDKANKSGGAIYWIGNNANINNINFINNTAGIDGGALYIISYDAKLNTVQFQNNNASNYGGAMYWAGTGSISDANFTFNRAYSGSAIYNAGNVNIDSTIILNNTANISAFNFYEDESNIEMRITTVVHGLDNFLNGIWTTSDNIRVKGVKYYGADGEVTSDPTYFVKPHNGAVNTGLFYDTRVAGIPINISYVNGGTVVYNQSVKTNTFGNYTYYDTKFPSANYTVIATHNADSYYFGATGNGVVEVGPIIPDLEVSLNTTEPYYDTNVTIRVKVVASDAGGEALTGVSGKVDIYVDDEFTGLIIDVVDGSAILSSKLPDKYMVGVHNISGKFYDGHDSRGNPISPINSSSAFYFNIVKNFMPSVINISTTSDIYYVGDEVNITIEGPSQYTGNISYTAGSVNGVCKLVNGVYVISTVYNTNGTVNVLAFVEGDDNYLPSSASYSFNVIKRNITINFDNLVDGNLSTINVSDNATIAVILDVNDAGGNIIITIDDVNYTCTITDGKGVVMNISSLAEGTHNVSAFYEGNYKYNPSKIIKTSLTVKKISIDNVKVTANNASILVGDNVTFTINLTTDSKYSVNGIANVTIAGKNYDVVIKDNVGYLTLSDLLNGTYDVNVCYADNQFNFTNITINNVITVSKINTSINITPVIDVIYAGDNATFNIKVDSNKYPVNGFATVNINGTDYIVSIIDGKGSLIISGLPYRNGSLYNVTVSYEGDYQFNSAYNETILDVEKTDISAVVIKLVNNPVYVGQDAVLNITMKSSGRLVNGYATLTIDGKQYRVYIDQGNAIINISGLKYNFDPYRVDFYYDGDDLFNPITEEDILEINIRKINIANITVNPTNQLIHVGDKAVLNFNISSSITDYLVNGFITVKVNGNGYNVSISNGLGSLEIFDLPYGNHSVFINYAGDEIFYSFNKYSSLSIANISVSKIDTSITMNNVSIDVGNAAIIVAHINNSDVTGNVTFVVNNKEYISGIVNGIASCEVYDLNVSANNTVISAVYYGDNKFYGSSVNATLFVDNAIGQIRVSVYDIIAGETEKVVIVLPTDLSNGTITVKFDNVTLNTRDYSIVRNVITFNRTLNIAGVYNVEVDVAGDAKYGSMNASDSFTVSTIADYPIFVKINDVILGNNATVFVTVPSDAVGGNVTINGVNYTIAEARNGIVLPKASNAGVHNVNVSYSDLKYGFKEINSNYTVFKAGSGISIIMNDTFRVGEDIKFMVNATNSTGRITVIINNKEYYPNNNTWMTVNPNLLNNTYNVVVNLEGDSNYDASKTSKLIHVVKNNVSITIDEITGQFNVEDNILITSRFNNTVTGNVIFNINGVNYTVNVNGNSVAFNYRPLTNGTFNVIAYYSGDYKFNSNSSNTVDFTVNKILTQLIITTNPIFVGQNASINVEVKNNAATGNVVITINNKNYTVNLVSGKGNVSVYGLNNNTDNNIIAMYSGDNKYNASYNTSKVVVNKLNIDVIVSPNSQNIYVGQKAVLNIKVTPSIANYLFNDALSINISGKTYNISFINNSGILPVYDLEYGNYDVSVKYNGNEIYNSFEKPNVSNITVNKVPVSITISPNYQSLLIGENIVINISVEPSIGNYTVNGFVTVKINNKDYNVSITDNKGQLIVTDYLLNNTYPVSVNYNGDNTFVADSASATVVVNKIPTTILMNDVTINSGNVAIIIARVNNTSVTGNVTFNVDNKEYVVGIIKGVATLEVYGLNTSANNTIIRATYSGDEKFINSETTANLFVNKINDKISISVYDINAGETENIIIVLPSDVSNGTIKVKFNNTIVNNNDLVINNNVITFNRTVNVSGNYTVDVSVEGDVKYNNLNANNSFMVYKTEDYNIIVNIDNVIVGENATIKVILPDDATTGTVIIENIEYSVNEARNGILLPKKYNTGFYDVNVKYVNDVKYDDKTVTATYRVYKASSNVSIEINNDFYVGDDISFKVTTTNSSGKITVIINNKEYYPVNNTEYTIVGGLANGTYDVIVKLDADANYNASKVSQLIQVHKKPVSITLADIMSPVDVDDNVIITANFDDMVTGNVIFNVNNVNYTVEVNGNTASYIYVPKTNGTYNVIAYYSGDDKFNPSVSGSKSFNVNKIPTIININVDPVYVGQDSLINVEVINNEATGNVVIFINNKNYTVGLVNGKGTVRVNELTNNTNNEIYAIYLGDNKYNSSSNVSIAIVNKVNISNIIVTPEHQDIYVGKNASLNIKFIPAVENYLLNGFAMIIINNTLFDVSIINNVANLNVSGLEFGTYSVDAYYWGDDKYLPSNKVNAAMIVVNKVDITHIDVSLVNQSIYVGQNAILDVNLTPALNDYLVNGYVVVNVNNVNYNVSISNNTGRLTVYNLPYGNYPITVTYGGDNTYNPKTTVNSTFIVVDKVPVSVIVLPNSQSIYVGDNAILNISIIPQVDGYVVNGFATVFVGNNSYNVSINNGTGYLVVYDLANATYVVDVDYYGDDTYKLNYTIRIASIYVNKRPTSISMNDVTINVGDVAYIEAVVNESSVTGDVIFTVDNKDYVVGIVNGVARLNVTGLNTSANRTITARYSGDYKFINSSTTALLTVSKVYGNASIVVYPITAGETETIIIKLPNDVSNGTITVKFNNNVIDDYAIENNVISFNRTLQVSGDYSVDINVDDDCKYYDFHNSTSFHVYKVAPENYTIVIEVNDTHVFENIPVIITLPNDANETLSLSVDGDLVNASVNVINGVATYTIGNLSYGNHTISVSYGNDKYDDKTVTTNVFVAKIDSSISIITPEDARVAHDIIINLIPVGSTGNVTVTINNKSYIVVDRAIVNVSELLEGNYTIVVNLDGDDNYLESTNSTTFIVSRNNVSMVLYNVSGELLVDSPIVLRVNFTENVTGSVIFNVNGMNYTVNITESDYAEYVWTPTAEGPVSVTASYSGNDTYYPSTTVKSVNFVVLRNLAEFTNVIVNDIMVGDVEEIVVTLNVTDITGAIYININGTVFEANVEGGLAFLSVPDLLAGDYNITVSYPGDRKYYAIDSYYESFTVNKYDSPIVIVAEDIMVLDDAVVNVSLPEEINDLITITVGDNSQNVVLVNGSASLVISNLSAGTYDVIVNYSGNAKYKANSGNSAFTVHRYNSTFDVNVSDVFWTGDDNNISVVLSDDATGNVTVSINGTDYVLPVVDGRVDFTVPELDPGDYEAIISYGGDYKYGGVEDSFNFTVIDNHPIMLADDVVKYYKGSERLRVNLTNVRGDKLANESVLFVINGVNYTRVTNDDGSCSLPLNLPSGEYDALIVYNSSKYGVMSKTVSVKILPTIVADDLVKIYRNNSQFYAYFCDSEGNALVNTVVTFNINGVFYNRTTNASGWAKLNINLPKGEYIITSYNPITGETCSNLITVLSRITENYDIVKVYRNGTQFTACILGDDGNPVGAGENVTFNINGVFYTRTTNATGFVKLNINLPEGVYIITTYYKDCAESNRITVLKNEGGVVL